MNEPADQKLAIDKARAVLTAAVRRNLIAPSEILIATIERIASQTYPPEVLDHVAEQLTELADRIGYTLGDRARTMERLNSRLSAFEKRLF